MTYMQQQKNDTDTPAIVKAEELTAADFDDFLTETPEEPVEKLRPNQYPQPNEKVVKKRKVGKSKAFRDAQRQYHKAWNKY